MFIFHSYNHIIKDKITLYLLEWLYFSLNKQQVPEALETVSHMWVYVDKTDTQCSCQTLEKWGTEIQA